MTTIQTALLLLVLGVFAGPSVTQQPPQASPTPKASPTVGEDEEGKDEKDDDFKEDEPVSKDDKARQQEIMRKACPAVIPGFSHESDKTKHPLLEPLPNKAIVYVVRPSRAGSKVQTKFAVDGRWAGVNRGKSYFSFELEPGEHYLCSKAENTSVLALKAEAGKIHYVEQKIKFGFMKARNQLAVLSESEGKEKLAKCKLSLWKQKP